MAITSSSKMCDRAIESYTICGFQRTGNPCLPESRAEQNLQNVLDTVQFSQRALDLLESFQQRQRAEALKEVQTTIESDSKLEKSMEILSSESDAGIEEIRKAYLHAIQQYHPDKHASLPPEFRRLAEIKTKQINEMYSNLLRQKTRNPGNRQAES